MRFLLYSYNFSPEKTGIGKYNGELADWLAKQGHSVDVITTNPYYPEWRVHGDYRSRQWRTERHGNLTVYRCPMYIPSEMSGKKRLLSDLSFLLFSAFLWLRVFFKRRYDVVIGVCPSLFVGFYPALYKAIRGGIFVYHIQDMQLDAAIQLGLIKNNLLIRLLRWAEGQFFRQATFVSSISSGMKANILGKGLSQEKYLMLENWVDTDFIKPLSQAETVELRKELGLSPTDRVILYSGNMGEKQGLEIIVEAAEKLTNHSDWKFVLCGDGARKDHIVALAKGLSNVVFTNLIAYERLPELLSLAEVHLVPQKRAAADLVLPSKMGGILAAGGLAIVAADKGTSLFDLIDSHDLGILIEPENVQQLVNAIELGLSQNNDALKVRTRQYARKYLNIDNVLKKFVENVSGTESGRF
ncbi:WcaI family glycosyltransferase [Persicitalea sp.]|uniref:WcaI family glycosyltransferase n=1 Tax=Persicitalea sp. TaxID=3100273 RepID=UPI003593070C